MIELTDHWNEYLEYFPANMQDVYFREEYVRLYETEQEKATCFVYRDERGVMIFPILQRSFKYRGVVYYDFESAYGYGGPISNNHSGEFIDNALECMKQFAIANNFICGFVRFHPILGNWDRFEKVGGLVLDRKTIAIDLRGEIETVWRSEIHTKNRNVIKKGERCGLNFIVDYDFNYLCEFEMLYNSTMEKVGADNFYFFPHSYYSQLQNTIQNIFLGIVKYENKVIAGAIFFFQLPFGHYHLAGSNKDFLNLSPNNFLLWGAAKELKNRGVSYFHLGGGTDGSSDNSLFQFKKKFSRNEYQFTLGKIIFNPVLYDSICADWADENPEKAIKMNNILLKYKY